MTIKQFLAVIALVAACDRPSSDLEDGRSHSTQSDSALRATPGYVIDSALPPGESLRRFRVGVDSVSALDGPATREALVRQFFAALDRRDGRALHALAVSKAEYAWIVFPGSRISLPPYNQPPDIAWLLMQNSSSSGRGRLLERVAGGRVQYAGHACDAPERDGNVTVHKRCWVRVSSAGEFDNRKLFGTIMEFRGRFKFLGFETEF